MVPPLFGSPRKKIKKPNLIANNRLEMFLASSGLFDFLVLLPVPLLAYLIPIIRKDRSISSKRTF